LARISPARTKKGTATRAKDSLPENMVWGIMARGKPLQQHDEEAAAPMASPTGNAAP
jgi:hypothetical protein